ncbi:MAG TPA: hypothetical protein DET40_03885 [Lentisphaeria bacterium]|nr:MAG: hypothetical protein A2X45_15320 [Lentisphaerae bacterium GWF2_50_93]HCE42666.1 hypothetical protein [Lentisphaeria bacterium]
MDYSDNQINLYLKRLKNEQLKMKKRMFKSFFDIDCRLEELDKAGDPLTKLNEVVNWESFREKLETIREEDRKSNAGRKPFDAAVMFRILILQSLNNLGNDSIEYKIRDSLSFMRFLGLSLWNRVLDDAKTIWLYREHIQRKGCRNNRTGSNGWLQPGNLCSTQCA